MIRLENVTKRYGQLEALSDVSFEAGAGQVVALLGVNGAGKTTAFKCMLGITPFEGRITIGGVDVRRDGKAARRKVGYVPQSPGLAPNDTCLDALRFIADLHEVDRSVVESVLDRVRLLDRADSKLSDLSGGMRQRLAVAAALMTDPVVLLLDEPTASLDSPSQHLIHEIIVELKGAGKSIVIATHYLDRLADMADRAVVLDAGRVAFDGPVAELTSRASQRKFTVNLNGTSTEAFFNALQQAGITRTHIRPGALDWQSIDGLIKDRNEEREVAG